MRILITKPGSVSKEDKKKLAESGVIAIEAENIDDVKMLNPHEELDAGDLFYSALIAIAERAGPNTHECFIKNMAILVKANRENKK